MDQNYSRPLRISGTGDASNQKMLARSTRVCSLSVRPGDQDVIVDFVDGPGGQILWSIEADNAAGSHSDTFPYPLLFPNGLYVNVSAQNSSWVINAAVIEPKSSGT